MSEYLPYARILLRYLFGGLASYGAVSMETATEAATNGDLALVAASGIGMIVNEMSYRKAKKNGGAL